jgi:hypothetical protein
MALNFRALPRGTVWGIELLNRVSETIGSDKQNSSCSYTQYWKKRHKMLEIWACETRNCTAACSTWRHTMADPTTHTPISLPCTSLANNLRHKHFNHSNNISNQNCTTIQLDNSSFQIDKEATKVQVNTDLKCFWGWYSMTDILLIWCPTFNMIKMRIMFPCLVSSYIHRHE